MNVLKDSNIKKDLITGKHVLLACGVEWVDSTTYSKCGDVMTGPRNFKASLGGLDIAIVSNHIYHRDTWVFSCPQLNTNVKVCIGCNTATEAAEYAVKYVKQRIEQLSKAIAQCK